MDERMDSKDASADQEADRHLIALNGLNAMLWMSGNVGQVTPTTARQAARLMGELAEWLQDKPGSEWLAQERRVATQTSPRPENRLAGLYSRPKEEAPKLVDAHVSGRSHRDPLDGAVKLACANVSGHSREQPLTSGQINQNNWGQSGPSENGDRVNLMAVMESLEGIASMLIGLQKNIDRVWQEVRRA